jgi:hypothetical protein
MVIIGNENIDKKYDTQSLIGWLPKFAMPKLWYAMILATVWLATKICQPLTFSLPNL